MNQDRITCCCYETRLVTTRSVVDINQPEMQTQQDDVPIKYGEINGTSKLGDGGVEKIFAVPLS